MNYFYPTQQQQSQYNTNSINQYPITPTTLPGKMVDSVDVAKVSDIPFGGYGVFPKGDLSEVYIKIWNNNGTTSLLTFKPSQDKEENPQDTYKQLEERVKQLEEKIEKVNTNSKANRKEVNADAF